MKEGAVIEDKSPVKVANLIIADKRHERCQRVVSYVITQILRVRRKSRLSIYSSLLRYQDSFVSSSYAL